ncbi:hypothetical protein [Rhodococcus koreensis]|uniref:hypothetical protein n=1 Tax=Rhodococcus koreensis TaxID=99653 RepID=UPI000ABB7D35|nr:hypothetical protein [Rhodococcus koreensis]
MRLISRIDAQIKRLPPPPEERLRRIDALIAELQRKRSEVLNEIATKKDFE